MTGTTVEENGKGDRGESWAQRREVGKGDPRVKAYPRVECGGGEVGIVWHNDGVVAQ